VEHLLIYFSYSDHWWRKVPFC